MKGIPLQHPYAGFFGYIQHRRDGRKHLYLNNPKTGKRGSILFSRYLVSVKLCRLLLPTEHVDHIDENRLNDSPDNLQLLSEEDHKVKTAQARAAAVEYVDFICPRCSSPFTLTARRVRQGKKDYGDSWSPCCSNRCATLRSKGLSIEKISRIKELRSQGCTGDSIASLLGITRVTVMKYW